MVWLIRTSGLIRTTFWRFPSYELAKHPCIVTKIMHKGVGVIWTMEIDRKLSGGQKVESKMEFV